MRHNILAGNDCGDEKSLVNIDTTTDWICELHIALLSRMKEAVTAPPHNKYRSIYQFLLCGLKRTTYLCLKDDDYTDLYTAFATGELRATPPSLPQFIRDVIFWRTWKEYVT